MGGTGMTRSGRLLEGLGSSMRKICFIKCRDSAFVKEINRSPRITAFKLVRLPGGV